RADRETPVPDRTHHVLPNAEGHHGLFFSEDLGILAHLIDALLEPRVPEGKGLVARKGCPEGCRHARCPAIVRRLIQPSRSAGLTRQWFAALNAGSCPDRAMRYTVFRESRRYAATSSGVRTSVSTASPGRDRMATGGHCRARTSSLSIGFPQTV